MAAENWDMHKYPKIFINEIKLHIVTIYGTLCHSTSNRDYYLSIDPIGSYFDVSLSLGEGKATRSASLLLRRRRSSKDTVSFTSLAPLAHEFSRALRDAESLLSR